MYNVQSTMRNVQCTLQSTECETMWKVQVVPLILYSGQVHVCRGSYNGRDVLTPQRLCSRPRFQRWSATHKLRWLLQSKSTPYLLQASRMWVKPMVRVASESCLKTLSETLLVILQEMVLQMSNQHPVVVKHPSLHLLEIDSLDGGYLGERFGYRRT